MTKVSSADLQELILQLSKEVQSLKAQAKDNAKLEKSGKVATTKNRDNTLWAISNAKDNGYKATLLYSRDADEAEDIFKVLVKHKNYDVLTLDYAQWSGSRKVRQSDWSTVKQYQA